MKNAALLVAGVIFALGALIHLWRLFDHYPIVINNNPLPFWTSGVAMVVLGLLSLWMFVSFKKNR